MATGVCFDRQCDALNRPVRVVGPLYTDAALGSIRPVTTFAYNPLGQKITSSDLPMFPTTDYFLAAPDHDCRGVRQR